MAGKKRQRRPRLSDAQRAHMAAAREAAWAKEHRLYMEREWRHRFTNALLRIFLWSYYIILFLAGAALMRAP